MLREETQKALTKFTKYVVSQSKANLTRSKMRVSNKLYDSIKGTSKANKNSFEMAFFMEQHGKFQDEGVKGAKSSLLAPNSPFRFGSGTGKKGGLSNSIRAWVEAKRIQFRDLESGRFMSYDQTARLISRSIYNKGLAPTRFFSKPFEVAFENLPKELVEAYRLDMEKFMDFTFKENDKKNSN